jgi:hypothetical protein
MNVSDFRALVEQRRSIRGYDESHEVSDEAVRAPTEEGDWTATLKASVWFQESDYGIGTSLRISNEYETGLSLGKSLLFNSPIR